MNLPNVLTMSRLVLAAALMLCLACAFPGARSLALVVFLVAAVTDYLDGYLARTVYGSTAFGRLMDPLADKILVCAAFVSFVEMKLVPAWIAVIIISREFLVTGLRLLAASNGRILSAQSWGKHKTVWQLLVIITLLIGLVLRDDLPARYAGWLPEDFDLLFRYAAWYLSLFAACITVLSGSMYFFGNRALFARHVLNSDSRDAANP